MDTTTPTQNQPITNPISTSTIPSLSKKSNSKIYIIFLSLLTISSLTISAFLYYQNQQQKTIINSNRPSSERDTTITIDDPVDQVWIKPSSEHRAIPIVKDGLLYLYSLTTKKLLPTSYKTSWGGGESWRGFIDPLPSPDGHYIAFINDDDKSLYVISSETLQAKKISLSTVSYINSWSSDSNKVLYYSPEGNIESRKEPKGMGVSVPWESEEVFQKGPGPGFQSFDINSGVNTYLYPLTNVISFIDSNRVLVETRKDQNPNKDRLVIFNVDTFTADYSTIGELSSSSHQWTFDQDAKFWSFTYNEGNISKIIYAEFPENEGEVIGSNSFARIQRPLVSPDNNFVAYRNNDNLIESGQYEGQYSDSTMIWDTSSKTIVKELRGYPMYWTDKDTILIGITEYGNNPSSYTSLNLYHLNTQEIEDIKLTD